MIVVIPAYQPDEKLRKLVLEIKEQTDYTVIVVNDGSRASCMPLFAELESHAIVLHQNPNRGKGAAMKTAFAYVREHFPETEGIITADADGQHLPKDIIRVSEAWQQNPDALVTGSRRFAGEVPWRSRTGNAITRFVFSLSTGVKVYDTQTGLRAFSAKLAPVMIGLKGDRYEYEINQLLHCTRHNIPIQEVEIATVYIAGNESSHYRAFLDSARIYKVIGLFLSSSVICFLFELGLTLLLKYVTAGYAFPEFVQVALYTAIPRILSATLNYLFNRKLVFKVGNSTSFSRYFLVAFPMYWVYYGLMYAGRLWLPCLPTSLAVVLAQLLCYPVNFLLQRKFVFKEK